GPGLTRPAGPLGHIAAPDCAASVQRLVNAVMLQAVLSAPQTRRETAVAAWLYACCAAIFLMVVIGGVTRLTESGLSIAEWSPLIGTLPPLTQAEWDRVFELYRQTSEYRLVNAGMTLAEFKTIFWWEYIHRLWGRMIGLIFFIPLVWFAWRGALDRRLGLKLLGIFALGGLQGAIGWWMVASGLVDRTDVSQYRLAVHLGVAFLIYALILWLALDLTDRPRPAAAPPLRRFAWVLIGAIAVTVVAGAFVAGTKAGLVYNTFPLMGGRIVPPDYQALQPGWLNAFENPAAIQFNHRFVAIATLLLAGVFAWCARDDRVAATPAMLLFAAALGQVALGIATLLLAVPLTLGVLHQAGALALLTVAIWTAHRLRGA